ncbi:MAG: DUF1186 domain-containing protein [Verrucomicrobia bacterium]|nr:DUF1186 domain-containing protein [Verrucomicrobiota bacterium]MBS0645153.1 DUF1186 domain-containing protein [Verrucomicrobiota bacterium]
MEIAHILEELAYDMGELPREAIEAAVVQRQAITPYLINILEETLAKVDEVVQDDCYQGHLYALYLLAQFREKRAYPLILQLFSFPGDIPTLIAGDVLTEDLSRILASVCDGDIAAMQQLIEDPLKNEYVRAACICALVTLVGCGLRPRKEILNYFQKLLEERLEKKPSFVWDTLILSACDLYPEDLYDLIKKSYEQGLVDSSFISFEDVSTILTQRKDVHLFRLFSNAELIDDTVSEMEKWLTTPIHPNYDLPAY